MDTAGVGHVEGFVVGLRGNGETVGSRRGSGVLEEGVWVSGESRTSGRIGTVCGVGDTELLGVIAKIGLEAGVNGAVLHASIAEDSDHRKNSNDDDDDEEFYDGEGGGSVCFILHDLSLA